MATITGIKNESVYVKTQFIDNENTIKGIPKVFANIQLVICKEFAIKEINNDFIAEPVHEELLIEIEQSALLRLIANLTKISEVMEEQSKLSDSLFKNIKAV